MRFFFYAISTTEQYFESEVEINDCERVQMMERKVRGTLGCNKQEGNEEIQLGVGSPIA